MNPKRLLMSLLPPIVVDFLRPIKRALTGTAPDLAYAPLGWETKREPGWGQDYAFPAVIAMERRGRQLVIRRLQSGSPLSVDPGEPEAGQLDMVREHNEHMIYAYALALAARQKQTLKILDYGGSMGDRYWLARALLPGVALEYHCKELPATAEEGRKLTPEAVWHTDDSCLEQEYDLVMSSASLQYIKDWQALLGRAAGAARGYLLLSDIPTVLRVPSYLALQRLEGAMIFHGQFNRAELLNVAEVSGLLLVREFLMGDHPPVANAPEQPSCRGWLFRRGAQTP